MVLAPTYLQNEEGIRSTQRKDNQPPWRPPSPCASLLPPFGLLDDLCQGQFQQGQPVGQDTGGDTASRRRKTSVWRCFQGVSVRATPRGHWSPEVLTARLAIFTVTDPPGHSQHGPVSRERQGGPARRPSQRLKQTARSGRWEGSCRTPETPRAWTARLSCRSHLPIIGE